VFFQTLLESMKAVGRERAGSARCRDDLPGANRRWHLGTDAGWNDSAQRLPPRTLSTTAGDLELRIPKLHEGSFFPSLL
jgi:hypothetical protein